MINKLFKKLFVISFLFLLGIFIHNFNVIASESLELYDKKIYCELNEDIAFENDTIIVIMDKLLSEKNKVHSLEFFGVDLFEKIKDLTYGDVNIQGDNFEQILELTLHKKNKEGVFEAIEILEKVPGIKYVGPNKIYSFNQSSNDTYYTSNNLWGLNDININNVWDYSIGNSEIKVGVIDSGISAHSDLDANVITGFDFVSENSVTNDDSVGHGTHVAGIIGAIGNNNLGVSGVNWNVSLVPLQVVTSAKEVSDSACVEAVNYATETYKTENPIRVLNFSIGSYSEWPEMELAIRQYPGLFVCAAGNDGVNTSKSHCYPGFYGSQLYNSPLSNILVVGAIDENGERSIWNSYRSSNYGTGTVDLYAPGSNIISTYPENLYNSSNEDHISSGYYNTGGTSMSTPYVTGVAALLLSINKDLSSIELKTAILQSAEEITITIPKNGVDCTPGSTEEQDVLKLNAYNAVKYVLENYMNSATYTLSNYSNTVDTSKTITSDASYFDELNGFYKLNVTYTKNYEFISTSTSGIEVTLYDEDFTEVTYSDLDLTSNTVHFIEKLNVGTYYFRVNYADEDSSGTINTEVISRNTAYLSSGVNDILINTYNEISEYTYAHNQGQGFYKFKLTAKKIMTNSSETVNITLYSSETIKIYTDQTRTTLLDRFENDVFSYTASSNTNENEMYVYLPSDGTYYIDILLPTLDSSLNMIHYSNVTIEIEEVEVNDLDYSSTLAAPSFNSIFDSVNKYSYFEKVIIDASSKIQIDVIANGNLSDSVPILMFKEEVDLESPVNDREYYLQTIVFGEVNPTTYMPAYTVVLTSGTYYIGYILNDEKVSMSIGLTRLVEYSDNMESVLVADPYYTGYDLGTEVLFNNGECNAYTITEGFTRNIYLMVEDRLRDPMSRLEYDWYSSNESVATVSSYGTVLARQVEIDTTVTIFAVLKEDPSIVYFKEFTILNDEEEELIEIELEMSYSYSEQNGTYQLELTNTNCPYPMIQYYDFEVHEWVQEGVFEVSLNYWGQVTATGPGACVIIGTYKLNPRVKIYINLLITE